MAPTEDDVATSHPQEIVDPPDVSRSAPSHRSVFLVELVLVAALSGRHVAGSSITTPNFMVNVFELDHEGYDGLLGMYFLRHFNFEIHPVDQQLLLELIGGDGRPVLDEE